MFTYVPNIGDARSLIVDPARITHREVSPEFRRMSGVDDNLIRLSIGLEDTAALIADLEQAIRRAYCAQAGHTGNGIRGCLHTETTPFASGWRDLNSRPLRPERSALPSCATARCCFCATERYCTTFGRLWQFVGVLHMIDYAEASEKRTVFGTFAVCFTEASVCRGMRAFAQGGRAGECSESLFYNCGGRL